MNSTTIGDRKHIVFYGMRNAGKSSIMNKILGQNISLVSKVKGTTTDPVSKSMELIPVGPVLLIDTGGLDDFGELGVLRVEKTKRTLDKADLAIYVLDGENIKSDRFLNTMISEFIDRKISYLIVVNKSDLLSDDEIGKIKKNMGNRNIIFTNTVDEETINYLKMQIIKKLNKNIKSSSYLADLVDEEGKIIMVIDNDSAAPKGRLILPQVQILRDALDSGIKTYVVRNSELESALEDLNNVDLVITDSKIFDEVDEKLNKNIKMTSFSILMAREKGDLKTFVQGVKSLEKLNNKENIRVLISEACTHATTHEDIGQVKIPNMLRKHLGKDIGIEFISGGEIDIPDDIDLLIHCGACMLNKKNMENRIRICESKNIPITNYGIFISYMLGILDRSIEIFNIN